MWLRDSQLLAAPVPELVAWLADPHYGRRSQAARTLVNRKEQPEVVWPALLAARANDCWMVRMQAPRAAVHLRSPVTPVTPPGTAVSIRFISSSAFRVHRMCCPENPTSGVGPTLAWRIVEARGRDWFKTVDDLRRVKGIGAKTFDGRPYVVVRTTP